MVKYFIKGASQLKKYFEECRIRLHLDKLFLLKLLSWYKGPLNFVKCCTELFESYVGSIDFPLSGSSLVSNSISL